MECAENTHFEWGSITVSLTSCLTGLDSTNSLPTTWADMSLNLLLRTKELHESSVIRFGEVCCVPCQQQALLMKIFEQLKRNLK